MIPLGETRKSKNEIGHKDAPGVCSESGSRRSASLADHPRPPPQIPGRVRHPRRRRQRAWMMGEGRDWEREAQVAARG